MSLPLAANTLKCPLLWSLGDGTHAMFPPLTIPPEALAEIKPANEDSHK